MIRKLLRAAIAASLIGSTADAQLLSVTAPLSPRALPPGVSIPTISSNATAYPGCPAAPTTFGNTWTIDPVNGFTMAEYNAGTGGAPVVTAIGGASGQGTATHPWNSLQALFGGKVSGILEPTSGYSQMLLATAPQGTGATPGPIEPGDKVVLMSGAYGQITGGGVAETASEIINVPALTIVAGSGQAPVLSLIGLAGATGFVFNGLTVQSETTSVTAAVTSVTAPSGNFSTMVVTSPSSGFNIGTKVYIPGYTTIAPLTIEPGGTGTGGAGSYVVLNLNTGSSGSTTGDSLLVEAAPLINATDVGIPGDTNSNIILENMTVSSASVATADGFNQAQFNFFFRPGIVLQASDNAVNLTCVSVVNSHVFVTNEANAEAIQTLASDALVMNNQIDHVATGAIEFSGSNTAIIGNTANDFVEADIDDQNYALQNIAFGQDDGAATFPQSNIYIHGNKFIESIDSAQLFNAQMNGYLSSCGDITNQVITDNLIAGTGQSGIAPGNTHNALIANNSVMLQGIQLNIAHCGSTGPEGNQPSNARITNNIATTFITGGSNVQADHNISAAASGFSYVFSSSATNGNVVFQSTTPGSVTAAPAGTGANNLTDGIGPTNEFTAVPTSGSFPFSPQPNFTPLSGSPAATMGGAVLIPPLTDFNGNSFTAPFPIGGLN
jgi:hypothetical protein